MAKDSRVLSYLSASLDFNDESERSVIRDG